MVPLGASLEIFERATISAVRTVSLMLTDIFIRHRELLPKFMIMTPDDPERRGGQVTLRHPEARRISVHSGVNTALSLTSEHPIY
jgi:kynureninase